MKRTDESNLLRKDAPPMQQQIQTALNWRYAVKKFNPRQVISDDDWKVLTQSLLMAPSSYGIQPWRFLVVQDPALREKLRPVSWNQSQVTDASHFVVFAAKEKITTEDVDHYIQRVAQVRGLGEGDLKGFRDMLTQNLVPRSEEASLSWAQRQAYIAMGFLLESAALLRIDSTPMEGLDPAKYDEILGLKGTGYRTVAAVALGYRDAEDQFQKLKKVRFDVSDVIRYL